MAAFSVVRRSLLALLVLGLVGTAAELLLLQHYEDPWQLVPLALIAVSLAVVPVHTFTSSALSHRVLQLTMASCVVAGVIGIGLHLRGAVQFQKEIDASQTTYALVAKALHAKAPPVLAAGMLAELGLLGLVYAFAARQPDAGRRPQSS